MKRYLSERSSLVRGSVIRQFAEAASKPGIISFANGNPSPETFATKDYAQLVYDEFLRAPAGIAQYGRVLGYLPLVEALKSRLNKSFGFDFSANELIITSGATQAADILSKILINTGDTVITEEPSYASYFNIFRSYGAGLLGVPMTADGMDMDELERCLSENADVKLIYTIPTFQNPSGYTMGADARRRLYELARRHDALILEDDPYSELCFGEKPPKPVKSLDIDGRVFYLGSLSKVIMPSVRLGYIVCNKAWTPYLNIAKQITDVHSGLPMQYMTERFINTRDYEAHISGCCSLYKEKSELMYRLLTECLPECVSISKPQGGLFIMLFLPEGTDSSEFARLALKKGVACVPGAGFMLDQDAPSNMLRLCYSTPSIQEIEDGVKILAEAAHVML